MNVSSSANSFVESGISAVAAPDSVGGRIEAQVADLEHGRTLAVAAARERAQAREQLGERERLDEVVVGAGVEARDAVVDGVARREHQHGRPDTARAQAATGLEAVDPRQHHVQDDRVVVGALRHPERLFPVLGDVHRKSLLGQAASDQARHPEFILDNEGPHALNRRKARMNGR